MAKKIDHEADPHTEDDEADDSDLNDIKDTVFRAILKNNRIMLQQNDRIIEILEKMEE